MVPTLIFFVFLTSLKGAATEATGTIPMSSREEKFRNLFESVAKNDQRKIHTNRDILLHEAQGERRDFDAVNMEVKSEQQKRKNSMGLKNRVRSRRQDAGSCSGYVSCASLTDDKVFQAIFRTPIILKPFLNELLVSHKLIRQELDEIEVRGEDQQIQGKDEYNTLHDVRARDFQGNNYVIEMERDCGKFDIIRFQHIAFKVFSKLMDARAMEMKKQAVEDAEKKTAEIKEVAAKVAREDASKKGLNEADTDKAVEKAVKAVRKVNPKRLSHSELYKIEDVPTVFLIVVTDGGLPSTKYGSKFASGDHYVLNATIEVFEEESRVHFVYVDLARFGRTAMSNNPVSPLDHWCSLMWNSKKHRLNKELYRKLEQIEGISEVAKRVVELGAEEQKEREADAKRDQDENVRLRMTMALLKKNIDLPTIEEISGYTLEELQELKENIE